MVESRRRKVGILKKKFNVAGLCLPDRHYMADIAERLEEIRVYIEEGNYFTISRSTIKINLSLAGISICA